MSAYDLFVLVVGFLGMGVDFLWEHCTAIAILIALGVLDSIRANLYVTMGLLRDIHDAFESDRKARHESTTKTGDDILATLKAIETELGWSGTVHSQLIQIENAIHRLN